MPTTIRAAQEAAGKSGHSDPIHHSSVVVDLASPGSSRMAEEQQPLPQNLPQMEDNPQVITETPREATQANEGLNNIARPNAAAHRPSRDHMKQQIELWRSQLAKDNLSPQVRATLMGPVLNFERRFVPKQGSFQGSCSFSRPRD